MLIVWTVLAIVAFFFLMVWFLYALAFGANRRLMPATDFIPKGDGYDPFKNDITERVAVVRNAPAEAITIKAFDGITLFGNYYHNADGAPLVLFFHGWRGTGPRDGCGAFAFCKQKRMNILLVDQRGTGKSDGRAITFGALERFDVLSWVYWAVKRFGPTQKILLMGLSMGAATLLMASAFDFPKNVKGIVADCGYTTARAIICKVMRQVKLPAKLCYPLVRLGARWFGRFDPDDADATFALTKAKLPILFIHGEHDGFVPHEMTLENHEACVSEKYLLTVPGADHAMSYYFNPTAYTTTFYRFADYVLENES